MQLIAIKTERARRTRSRGALVNLVAREDRRSALAGEARTLGSLQLSPASAAWLQLLATGALSPLDRFLGRADYESVSASLRLADGAIFPVPVILPVNDPDTCREGARVALRDSANHLLALLTVEEIFPTGPGPAPETPCFAVSGPLEVLRCPEPLLFPHLHRTAAEVRQMLAEMEGRQAVAADCWDLRDPRHAKRLRATAEERDACLLLNLPATSERIDDFTMYRRLRQYEKDFRATFGRRAILNYLNVPYGASDVRGALLKAMIHRNYGAHGYIFDAEKLSAGGDGSAGPEQSLPETMAELGLQVLPAGGEAVEATRTKAEPSRERPAGICIWLTGLPGAGKSTIAERLTLQLMERGRRVTLLDGDVVRTHLSRGLSFSREDRDTNVQRIGFVAAEIVRHEGIAVCAAVSPYRAARERVREMMPAGAFVEVFVDTPLRVCEQRDVKGFYAKARSGQIRSFTGVDDPYEAPEKPEVRITTCNGTPEQEARLIVDYLLQHGSLR
jgi:sulfate adenylyltransferase